METVEIESCVRGHHVYKLTWKPKIGEKLQCYKEEDNLHDRYTVAVTKGESKTIVGHVPCKISAACYLFLEKEENSIVCKVTGERVFSKDLPQGGLQVPCALTFRGRAKEVHKIVKLLKPAAVCDPTLPPPTKKSRIEQSEADLGVTPNCLLNEKDQKLLLEGGWLSDIHVNLAQRLLSKQFPKLSGLESTLLLPQAKQIIPAGTSALQIIHSRGNHWIVASTIGCQPGEIKIFDSLYKSIDLATITLISTIFRKEITTLHLEDSQQQQGSCDCGVFAIATTTALAHGVTPTFKQEAMRHHLYDCFCSGVLTPFP